jgi:proteasome lid subunit RPN8/RPN11
MSALVIPERILEVTSEWLRRAGKNGVPHEGVTYLAGTLDGVNGATVTTCLAPEAETAPSWYSTSAVANAAVVAWVREHKLDYLGQVHSHPGTRVGHSNWDERHAFMPMEGTWSIVVPNYARDGMKTLSDCGVHRMENGAYRRLLRREVAALLTIGGELVDGLPAFVDFGGPHGT